MANAFIIVPENFTDLLSEGTLVEGDSAIHALKKYIGFDTKVTDTRIDKVFPLLESLRLIVKPQNFVIVQG